MIELPPDITFLIQIVSFLVFWQLMKRILFTPVQGVLAARAARTTGDQQRAENLRAEASALAGQVEADLDQARLQGAREAEGIRGRGEIVEREILERYRGEAAALLEGERAVTESQLAAARGPLEAEAELLAASVVGRVLGRAA